jgi:hypothetical protein
VKQVRESDHRREDGDSDTGNTDIDLRRTTVKKILLAAILVTGNAWGEQPQPQLKPASVDSIAWYSVSEWGVEGRGWADVKRYYDRLPMKAEGVVRDKVWDLSRNSSGMSCRFVTDASEIRVRYLLSNPRLEMPHMPATGVSGVDLYTLLEDGTWHWIATSQPLTQRVASTLVKELAPGKRTFMLYLPLYNGVDSLDIGVPAGAKFEAVVPRLDKPLVFYGTSIMQGACASRPGMAIPAILGRRLNIPTINLGFSGNGKLEREVGTLMTELDAALYVLDCLPNLTAEETAQRVEPFVRLLREQRPATPVLLVEDRVSPNAVVIPGKMKNHEERHRALRAAYEKLISEGMQDLYYLEGDGLLGHDGDATVDGSHPTDLGMIRYADSYERALSPLIRRRP